MTDKVNFGDELVTPEEKTRRVGAVFSSVARRYDLMNDLMSGGMHRLWKDRFVARVKPRAGERILDMAGGTGDIAFRMAAARRPGHRRDINPDMLDVGMERAEKRGIDGLDVAGRECREAELRRPQLRRLHDRLRHPERHRHPGRPARSASRAEARRALLLPRILDQRMARLRPALRALFEQRHPAHRQGRRRRRGQLSLPGRIDPPLPASPEAFRQMIGDAGFVRTSVEPILGGLVAIHSGWKI